ncbi:Hydantoinase/oxoprolinase-domain-containing protein [Mycena floridula]|nr:Hydantoinase/oxoprolinase-domain-containing protein [Mycena floridula]
MASPWKVGVDVGGTFTDAVLVNVETGTIYRAKTLSTPQDQSVGVLSAIEQLRSQAPEGADIQFSFLNHGTTIATNAILEGKGARVALLVTDGYKSILQVRRSQVPGGLAGWIVWPKPEPLAPLELTIEVPGRISTTGEIIREFDEAPFRSRLSVLKRLPESERPESITISLINSFANPAHELAVAAVVASEFPNLSVSLSSQVLPEMMEYERTVTTVANSYVKPVASLYLENLQAKLGATVLKVLRSDGGLASVDVAKEHCVNLLYSGPAGGIAGVVARVASKTKFKNLLTFDMGGTSTDVTLIKNGIPELRRESTIGDLTVRAPSIDVRTVGAGGGSIASVAPLTKALRVGPESAGALPGPACYSKGGERPTVTDACAVLGYLPLALLGGSFKLDIEAACTAINKHIAEPMGLSLEEAAEGIIKIAAERMYGSLRSVSVEKGQDPREFSLVAFGGAGGLFVCELASLCGSYPAIVPPAPGVLCALGDVCTSLRHEVSETVLQKLDSIDLSVFVNQCEDLAKQATSVLTRQGVPSSLQKTHWEADCRYHGQALSIPVSFEPDATDVGFFTTLTSRFNSAHLQLFTFSLDAVIEIVNLRAVCIENVEPLACPELSIGTTEPSPDSVQARTSIFYGNQRYENVCIYNRGLLRYGDKIDGPCIVSEADSNTFINPAHRLEIDAIGNILVWPVDDSSKTVDAEKTTDAIVVQLIEAALQNTRYEMDGLIQRVAMSPAMREQLDYFPMIADSFGRMVCGQFGSFIPGFLKSWEDTIEDGDVFLTNDPYSVSNAISHLNDFLVVTPIFYGPEGSRKIVAWCANLGHFTDIGSCVPGSMPHCATSIYEDGIQIPLCKLYSKGIANDAVFRIVERNSRKEDFARSDLHALVAATRIAGQRVIEMCDRFGVDAYEASLEALLARNFSAVQSLIKTNMKTEPIYFEDFIDDDGFGCGPWKIACTMYKRPDEKHGEVVVFDFNGTDPQSERSINFALSHEMLKMFVIIYLVTVNDPGTVVNDGAFDLIDIILPPGTILSPIRPAALSCRTPLLSRLFDIIGALFGMMQPEFMNAAGFSDSPHFFYSGWTDEGEWFELYQIGFGGIPARPWGDGPDGHSLWPSMRAVPNEFLESYLPMRVDRYETVVDSGGAGLYRGGNAMRIDYVFLEPGNISIHDDRWLTKPWGVHGGGTGQRSSKVLVKYSVDAECPPRVIIKSKEDFVAVEAGDVLEWMTWGGGGWGSPLRRDPALVAKEYRRGLVKDTSRYGVVLSDNDDVDISATERLRASMEGLQSSLDAQLFNRGGTIRELLERCEEETGHPRPSLPSQRKLRGPAAKLEHIQKLHSSRQDEDKAMFDI